MRRSVCVDCRVPVLWTITEAGRRLAVEPDPHPEGNTAVRRDGLGAHRSRRPTEELPLMGWERLHRPHVAVCVGQGRPPAPARPGELPPGVADLASYRSKSRNRP